MQSLPPWIVQPFALYYYSEGSGKPEFIYVGANKGTALDNLLQYFVNNPCNSQDIYIEYAT